MQLNPTVSIVLPALNAQPHLRQAISSMLDQTFEDFELIVLEDGSSDDSLEYLKSLTDPRLRIFHDGLNKGLVCRLNQGIALSRGKYICRMDADDISMKDRLLLQTQFLDANSDIDLVGGVAIGFNGSKGLVGYLPFELTHERLCARPWNRIPLPHPTWMARRDWFEKYRYRTPEVLRAEDQDLLIRAYPTSRYSCVPETVLAYRLRVFPLKSLLISRFNLVRAQVRTFYQRKQPIYLMLAVLVFFVKSALDFTAKFRIINLLFARYRTPSSWVFNESEIKKRLRI